MYITSLYPQPLPFVRFNDQPDSKLFNKTGFIKLLIKCQKVLYNPVKGSLTSTEKLNDTFCLVAKFVLLLLYTFKFRVGILVTEI